jgi:hypothetical protein
MNVNGGNFTSPTTALPGFPLKQPNCWNTFCGEPRAGLGTEAGCGQAHRHKGGNSRRLDLRTSSGTRDGTRPGRDHLGKAAKNAVKYLMQEARNSVRKYTEL